MQLQWCMCSWRFDKRNFISHTRTEWSDNVENGKKRIRKSPKWKFKSKVVFVSLPIYLIICHYRWASASVSLLLIRSQRNSFAVRRLRFICNFSVLTLRTFSSSFDPSTHINWFNRKPIGIDFRCLSLFVSIRWHKNVAENAVPCQHKQAEKKNNRSASIHLMNIIIALQFTDCQMVNRKA